jgi:hypothetical protein
MDDEAIKIKQGIMNQAACCIRIAVNGKMLRKKLKAQ